jgi:hypothetical protein
MPGEDIPEAELQDLAKVHWDGEKAETIEAPPDPTVDGGDWYIGGGVGERDVFVNASRAADVSGTRQQIHMHPKGTSCQQRGHTVVDPDPVRSAAVGGDARAQRRQQEKNG